MTEIKKKKLSTKNSIASDNTFHLPYNLEIALLVIYSRGINIYVNTLPQSTMCEPATPQPLSLHPDRVNNAEITP